jgi:hypothetical protein
MRSSQAILEHRRRHIRAKIAAQRVLLAQQVGALRGPAAVFDKVRAFGVMIHTHAGMVALAGSVMMLLHRKRLLPSVVRGWRLARRLRRLFSVWKTATAFLRRHPAPAA